MKHQSLFFPDGHVSCKLWLDVLFWLGIDCCQTTILVILIDS